MALELWYTNCLSVDLQSPIAALPANTVILLTETCLDPGVLDVLIGNFNAHIDWWQHDEPLSSDAADDSLRDTVTTADLHQVCQHPSYSSQGRASFLDLVFVLNISRVTSCEVLPGLTGSDHSAIEISYATILPRKAAKYFHGMRHDCNALNGRRSNTAVARIRLLSRCLDGSLDDSYISSVVRYSKRTGQPEPMYARTVRHQNSLIPAAVRDFLSAP
ncbi:hypothetical protein HPB49_014012 [Dermacentor silvarum]|uniref:Uncharacterized protein n=1 Tax=Dermacentor silvarum TaxID=543639 RepID=A0ACB8DPD8_DERSI|nr:hypothetical protein HPB49_014012 [Dermacentor silvarum]